MTNIKEIESMGPVNGDKLVAAGISTQEALLSAGAISKGRATLAETTGISEAAILE